MKNINDFIRGNFILEGRFPQMDIETFISIYNGDEEYIEDFGIDEKTLKFIKDHCKIIERGGGHNGNGDDAWSYLTEIGFPVDKLTNWEQENNWTDICDVFNDSWELDKDWLKAAGKIAGINAKYGSTFFTSGYESPTFVLFDQNNAIAKGIISSLEGWY